MKTRRYYIVLAALLVLTMLAPSALAIPERPPKQNFQPRKKKVTVARLKEAYGKPVYHLKFDEEVSETIVTETHKKIGTIYYDEEIVYYFTKGKFLARVIKGGSPDAELPKLLPH